MLRPSRIALFCLLLFLPRLLLAQFAGTYSIGPGGDFATLTAALTALRNAPSPQLAGHVTLLLSDGAHTPPTGGFVVPELTGSGPDAILTIRPAPGASVVIRSGTTPALIDLNSADYVVIDGRDSLGGGALMISCSAASGSAVRFVNGATHDTLRNLMLLGNGSTSTFGVVRFDGTNNGTGNTDNVVADNVIGDTSGTLRANAGVTMIGNSASPNLRNRVTRNEIVNPGRGAGVAYGVYMGSNNGLVVIEENEIHCTAVAGTENLHPLYGVYITNGANRNDTIARNRIHSLLALNPTASRYGVYVSTQGTSPIHLISNMIALESDSGLLAGIHTTEPDSIHAIGNTILLRGSIPTSASTQGIASTTKGRLWFRNNLIVIERPAATRGATRCLAISAMPNEGVIDHNAYVTTGDSAIAVARGSVLYDDIASWSGASGYDVKSVAGPVVFMDPSNGDLHIDPAPLYSGEGMGTPLNGDRDIDGDDRDSLTPDIGADEGDFNGGRLRLIAPNDTVFIAVGMRMRLTLAASRKVEGIVHLIPEDGTPRQIAQVNLDTGHVSLDPTIPDGIRGLNSLRVINLRNLFEGDTADGPVIIVDPIITIVDIGGGEEIVEGDTLMLEWTAVDCPPSLPLELSLTTDNGQTWRTIDTTLRCLIGDGRTITPWIVPVSSAGTCRIRLAVRDGAQGDTSDSFVVLVTPTIDVDLPPAAPADTLLIVRWNAVGCRYVRVLISTDGGMTWIPLIPGNPGIPAWIGRAAGRIPITDSTQLVVRVVDAGRPRIGSSRAIRLRHPWLLCRAPVKGERRRLGEAIDIVWSGHDIERLRIDYSDNDGSTWSTVLEGVDGRGGWRRYVPERRPTMTARIRLIDMDNPDRQVVSDRFAILPASAIMAFSPTTGEKIERSAPVEITWIAEGIQRVSLYYTTNNGGTWTPIALDIPAERGSHLWTAPSRATEMVRIRIRESGGLNYTETGTFRVIDPEPLRQSLSLLSPSGVRTMIAGDEEIIRWRGVGFRGNLRIEYSIDSGARWSTIDVVPVGIGRHRWSVPFDTTSRLLLRIASIDLDLSAMTLRPLRIIAPSSGRGDRGDEGSIYSPSWRKRTITTGGGIRELRIQEVVPHPVIDRSLLRWSGSEEGEGPGEGVIHDMTGRRLRRMIINEEAWRKGEIEIDLTGLSAGIYLVTLQRGSEFLRGSVLHLDR